MFNPFASGRFRLSISAKFLGECIFPLQMLDGLLLQQDRKNIQYVLVKLVDKMFREIRNTTQSVATVFVTHRKSTRSDVRIDSLSANVSIFKALLKCSRGCTHRHF